MLRLKRWMQIVGAFYVLQFVMMAFVRAPIRAMGHESALAESSPLARFLVDTWVTFGLEVGAVGAGLLIFSRAPDRAKPLIWTVIGIELLRGIAADVYMLARGNDATVIVTWMVIHTLIIATGVLFLRSVGSHENQTGSSSADMPMTVSGSP